MEKVLVVVHTDQGGQLPKFAWEAIAAGLSVGGEVTVGVFGAKAEAAAAQAGAAGVSGVLFAAGSSEVAGYAVDVAAVGALFHASGAGLVVAPASSRMVRCMPGAAVRCGAALDTQVSGISTEGGLQVQRWYYRQRMVATLSRAERPWFLTVSSGSFAPASPAASTPVAVKVEAPATRTKAVGVESASPGEQTVRPDAELLFVAGAGWCKKQADGQVHVADAESLILGFLARSGASLGSSKSLVDQSGEGAVLSFLTHLHQVGQTGSTPRHPKGLATCCHGEEPHVVGWRFIGERRVVNTDAACGWAQGKADVVYVADAFAVMKRVNELLG